MKKHRDKNQAERDRRLIASYMLQGLTQTEISNMIQQDPERDQEQPISRVTVNRDIKRIKREWQRERVDELNEYISRQIATLRLIQKEAWSTWHETSRNEYLLTILKTEERLARLLGLDRPVEAKGEVGMVPIILQGANLLEPEPQGDRILE